MKKVFLSIFSLMTLSAAYAQPWGIDPSKSLKLTDIVAAYEQEQATKQPGEKNKAEEDEEGNVKEDDNYHFRRWLWYWERHLDENGYLVSPAKTWNEWKKYKEQKAIGALSKTTANQSNWTFEGPFFTTSGYNGIGRLNVIEFHPTDVNTYWVGSAGGGAWKTIDDGLTWTNMTNELPVLGIADIDINPQNPNTIYLCTGDRDNTDNFSVGVLRSTDGGITWDTTGFKATFPDMTQTNCLLLNPQDTTSLTLATNDGIFKSYDAGATWAKVENGHFKQLLYHPTDTSIAYATSYINSSPFAQIFRTTNGGLTWQQVTSFTGTRRIALATSVANPGLVMAVACNTATSGLEGVYQSTNSGQSFTKIFSDNANCDFNILHSTNNSNPGCSGQSWYDLTIAVSPTNPNIMVVGAVNTWYSSNGGTSWQQATRWSGGGTGLKVTHADKHWHMYHPLKPATLYECNDGGLYKTDDPMGQMWTDVSNGLFITQYYRNAVSSGAPFVLGGAQDNGSQQLTGALMDNLTGGDGMDCQINPANPGIFYTSIQYGELRRTTNGGLNFDDIQDNIPGNPDGDWITPFVLLPHDPTDILAGYDKVWYSGSQGDTWQDISPVFYNNQNIKRIAVTPANFDYIYVLVNNRIHYTTNFGGNWNILPTQFTGNISDILVDHKDPTHIWVTSNGYNATSKVAEYSTSAVTWKNLTDQLPNIPINCITQDTSNNTLYIGTDIGIFAKDTAATTWEPFDNNLPNVEVTDLAINYTTGEIWASTYGRGMWKSIKHTPGLSVNAHNNFPMERDVITVVPNPNNGNFELNTGNKSLMGQRVHIRIVSMTGAVVWENDARIDARGKVSINAELARGAYLVDVNKEGLLFARSRMVIN